MKRIKLHWTFIFVLLVLTVLFGSLGVGILIQKNPLITNYDTYFYELLAHNWHSHLLDTLITPFNFNFLPWGGPNPVYLYFLTIPVLIYLWIYKKSLFGWFILSLIIAYLIALLTTFFDWHFVFRQRPFLVMTTDIPTSAQKIWGVLSSFPSGHTRDTIIFATIIASFIPELLIPMVILSLFVGFSRVYVGAHYPTDVLAGLAIGFLSAKASLILSRELQIIYDKRKGVINEGKPKAAKSDIKDNL